MDPLFHFIISLIGTILGYKLFSPPWLIGFFLSAAFLDIDHYFYYLVVFRDWRPQGALQFFERIRHRPKKAFALFHTVEFILLVGLITFILRLDFLYGYTVGTIFHLLIDLGQAVYFNEVDYRWWSLVQYLHLRGGGF